MMVNIVKKSEEELENQVRDFLKRKTDNERIKQSKANEILENLDMEGKFLLWLKEKTNTTLDLHNKGKIRKKLFKTMKGIDDEGNEMEKFSSLRYEYLNHMRNNRKDILIKKIIEPYNITSKTIHDYIKQNLGNKENIQKLLWLWTKIPEQDFIDQCINNHQLYHIDSEVRSFLEQFKDISKGNINVIIAMLEDGCSLDMIKLFVREFDIHSLDFFSKDEIQRFLKKNKEEDIDVVSENIQLCKKYGISDINKIIAPIEGWRNTYVITFPELEKKLSFVTDELGIKDPKQLYENLIEVIQFDYTKLKEWMNILPNTHYEGNGGYTSKIVEMEGGDYYNDKMTKEKIMKIFGTVNDKAVNMLKVRRTDKRTKNRKKNLDFAKEVGIIASTEIIGDGDCIDPQRNRKIAAMKTISYEDFTKIINKIKDLGADKEEIEKFSILLLGNGNVSKSNKKLNILIDDIGVKDYKRIIVSDKYISEDPIKKILNYDKVENLEKNIQIIRYMGIETTEKLIEYISELDTAEPKNLQTIINSGIIEIDDLMKLKDVLKKAKTEFLKETIDMYKLMNDAESIAGITEFILHPEEFKKVKEKYPDITIEDLVKINTPIKKSMDCQRNEVLEKLNIYSESFAEGADLLHLNFWGNKHAQKIFDRIKEKDNINDKNRVEATCLYSTMEMIANNKEIFEEVKSTITELFGQERMENKDFIYVKIRKILDEILDPGESKLDNKKMALIEIVIRHGLLNLPLMENLIKFIYQLILLSKSEKTPKNTKIDIKERIKKFLQKQKNRSNEDLNSFYSISTNILKIAPSLYNKIVGIFERLEPSNIKYFYEKIFPLYNVELVLYEKKNKHEINDLTTINSEIKKMTQKIRNSKNIKETLEEEKDSLTEKTKTLFKKRFGIIKIPEQITEKNIESIMNHSLYLSNMASKIEEKEIVLGFFLALKLNNKRENFRSGEKIDPKEYMDQEKTHTIQKYMENRDKYDVLKDLGRENKDKNNKILQESEVSRILGNTESISNRLLGIDFNIQSLLDTDFYQGEEKIILKNLLQQNDLGKTLALRFQELSGKTILSDQQKEVIANLEKELGKSVDIDEIKHFQGLMKGISPIINFTEKVKGMEINREIEEFEKLKIPNNELMGIFNKIGENFTTESGIMAIRDDVQYLELKIDKDTNILTLEEKNKAKEYLSTIKKELMDLYKIKDQVDELYQNFKKQIQKSNNQEIKNKLNEIEPLFKEQMEEGKKENIISLMTNDLDIVIKNIRQCLGCMTAQCNNDTNLSFGTNNRFLITTSNKEGESSYADELVTLLPSDVGLVFVMDKVYGRQAPDILVGNTIAIIQKLKKIHTKDIGILISRNAMHQCQLSMEYIQKRLAEEGIKNFTIENTQSLTVHVPDQPIGDGHYEFGEIDPRGKGDAKTSGILLYMN